MIIAMFKALIVLLVSVLLGFEAQGGLLALALVCVFLGVLAVTSAGLGLIAAIIVKNPGAASGRSAISIAPMMMFGAFLVVFDGTTRSIARFTPDYYATDSLSLIFNGASLSDGIIWQNLLILMVISLIIVVAGIQLFERTEFRLTLLPS